MTIDDKSKVEARVPCEVYSRIVGYLRPVQHWNTAKQLEFKERKTFGMAEFQKADEEEEEDD